MSSQLDMRLVEAAYNGDVGEIVRLRDEGLDLNGVNERGSDLLSLFIWQCCAPEKIRALLSLGVRPANQNCNDITPFIAAVWTKNPEIVSMVIHAHADPNVIGYLGDDEATALDTVLDDFCECDTEQEYRSMKEIEAMIRKAGGKTHMLQDWSPPKRFDEYVRPFIEGVPNGNYCYGYLPAPDSGFTCKEDIEAYLKAKYKGLNLGEEMVEFQRLSVVKHCKFWNPTEHGFVECTHLNRRALWITTKKEHIEKAIAFFGSDEKMEEKIQGYLLGDAVKECRLNRTGLDFTIQQTDPTP